MKIIGVTRWVEAFGQMAGKVTQKILKFLTVAFPLIEVYDAARIDLKQISLLPGRGKKILMNCWSEP